MKLKKIGIALSAVILLCGVGGCRHKPAYSEMNPEGIRNQNRNSESAPAAQTAPASPQASANPAPVKRPSFLTPDGGAIRDLPDYPGGRRQSAMMGPNQGVNRFTLALTTRDPMEKITSFYDEAVRTNRWTVVDRLIDPEYLEWSLKKGETDTATVTVKRDSQTGLMTILVTRGEKLEEAAK